MHDRKICYIVVTHIDLPSPPAAESTRSRFKHGSFLRDVIPRYRQAACRRTRYYPVGCTSHQRDEDFQEFDYKVATKFGQNRAVALRRRTLEGEAATQVYDILRDSGYLERQPKPKKRAEKLLAKSES
jgi:hypothetical protein